MITISSLSIRDDRLSSVIVRWTKTGTTVRVRWRWMAKGYLTENKAALVAGAVGAAIASAWTTEDVPATKFGIAFPRRPGFQVAVELAPMIGDQPGAQASASIWCL